MDFNTYSKMVICKMQLFLGNEYELELTKVTKNNGLILNGIIVKREDSNIFPTVYIDDFYREDITVSEVEYLAMKLKKSIDRKPFDASSLIDDFKTFNNAKNRIVYKLINAEKNKELLTTIPYRRFHNLAICYCYHVDEINGNDSGSVLIKNEHIKGWNVNEEELYLVAYENTLGQGPVSMCNLKDVVESLCGREINISDVPLYMVSNEKKINGSYAMLYIDKMREFGDRIGDDYYIIPSSIHELLLIPKCSCADVKDLLTMVIEVNKTEVSKEEYLADSIYAYDSELNEIVWVC